MRAVIVLALMVILSAPDLAKAPLDAAEAARFVAAAGQAAALESPAGKALPLDAPGRVSAIAESAPDLLARHGFTAERWRVVGQRVLAAYQAQRYVDRPAPPPRKGAQAQPAVAQGHWERALLLDLAKEQRADLAQLAEETEADRQAIAPLLPALHGLMGR